MELIDTAQHGFNGETSDRQQASDESGERLRLHPRIEGNRVAYRCKTCGPQPMTIYGRFEYSGDRYKTSDAKFAGRWQDLFSWFTLLGRCLRCDELRLVTDHETA
jgi:hypothetical protein